MKGKLTRYAVLLLGMALMLASCQKAPELTITSSPTVELNVDGSSGTITFTANRAWTVSSSDSWVSVSPSSGEASDKPVTVSVRCNANTTYDDRTATVTIRMEDLSQSVTIKQPANKGVVLPKQVFDLQSDAKTIDVEVQANVQYTVSTSVSWIKQTGTKGLTSKTLTFSIEENKTYDPREGKITIKPQDSNVQEQVISVKQAQKDALNVEKTSYEMPYGGGEIEIKVEANVSFDVTPNADWIHYTQTKALSSSTVCLKIDENKNFDAREGKVEIAQKNGTIKHSITIKQQEAPGLFVDPTKFDLKYDAQTIEINIRNNISLNIVIPDNAKDWISVQSNTQTKALTDDKIVLAITQNSTSSDRSASVSIQNVDGAINETVTINQAHFDGLSVTPSTFYLSKESQTFEVHVLSSEDYDAVISSTVVSEISKNKTSEIETVYQYKIEENIGHSNANVTITYKQKVSGQSATVKITQEPTYYCSLWSNHYVLSYCEQQYTLMFESNIGEFDCSFDQDWVRYISSTRNPYINMVFVLDENTSYKERKATLTIKRKGGNEEFTFLFVQQGKRDAPSGTVEMGLSVLWAECNIDASSPEGFGEYYAWGELEPKETYSWGTYKWGNGYASVTYYTNDDGKETLEPEDDVARVKLGNHWHIPTLLQWRELLSRCVWGEETINGVSCMTLTSPITGNKLILPNAGYKYEGETYRNGISAHYWSNTRRDYYNYDAWCVNRAIGDINAGYRCMGLSVRPVYE